MNFDFSDDQKQLRDQARKFLAEKCSPKAVRVVLDGKAPYDKELWKGLAEMGFLGVAIPEEFGGAGAGHLELCVIAEEMGRANAPVPFSSTVYLAAEALLLAGSEAQKQKWLPKLASGEAIGTPALTARWRWAAIMRWTVLPSAGRAARSRRSSTSSPTCMSRRRWHDRTVIT